MGEVWKAHNEVLDVDVALKVLRRDVDNPGAGDRLLREARAAARLGHPAIVRIFDYGTAEGGEPFIVMELLEGEDLASGLERHGRMSATRSVRTVLPVAHALAAAHAKGIVHRDIKPENIFLARIEGDYLQPKIVDFGIAQLDYSKNLRLTQAGALIGTPLYMSPEQARGETTDHRADIWSMCVVLYEMVTGRLPFEGKNANALLHAITMNEVPPITTFGTGDPELWDVLSRGLTKNPDERYQSMQELGEALANWLLSKNVTEDLSGASVAATWFRGSVRPSSLPPPGNPVHDALAQGDATTQVQEPSAPKRRTFVTLSLALFLAAVAVLLLRGRSSTDATPGAVGTKSAASGATTSPSAPAPGASMAVAPAPPLPSADVDRLVTIQRKVTTHPANRTAPVASARKRRILKDPFQ